VAISAGVSHALGANWDGTVTAWGSDFHGQASVPAGLSNVVSVSAGAYFSLAVKADGTLAAWGKITDGWDMQPITIPESATNVALVSGGQLVAAALREDGNVILWNGAGLIPTPPDWTNIVSLAASGVRVVAVRSDSSVAILNVQT